MNEPVRPIRRQILYLLGWLLFRAVAAILFRFTVRGRENIPREGGVLLAANHASFMDPVLVGLGSWRPFGFLARDTLFRSFVMGWVLPRVNVIPLRRGAISPETMRKVEALLRAGSGIIMFPEGTRSRDGRLQPLRGGIIRLAQAAGVPVVPCWVWPTHRALGRDHKFPRPCRITVRYGEPIEVPPDADPDDVLETLRARLDSLRLATEGENPSALDSAVTE